MKKSFCFVLNPLEINGNLPVELIPNHFLQRADSEQIELIQMQLGRGYGHNSFLPAYEYEWLEETRDDKGGVNRASRPLPKDKHRYWVVTFDGPNTHIQVLQLAVDLLKHDLDFGFLFLYWNEEARPGIMSGGPKVSTFFESHFSILKDGFTAIEAAELASVNDYFQSIKACEKDNPHVYKATRDFFYLKSLPRTSELLILGYFAVIESLVTHNPKDDYDSLNHQISTKMVLLSKKFARQLDYGGHFNLPDQERVWKNLYAYRSALAHGATVDFKTKFSSLKDAANVRNFLREATKLTLLFAMKEPDFLSDLQRC